MQHKRQFLVAAKHSRAPCGSTANAEMHLHVEDSVAGCSNDDSSYASASHAGLARHLMTNLMACVQDRHKFVVAHCLKRQ